MLFAGALALAAASAAPDGHAGEAPPREPALREVAPGVWVLPGRVETLSRANRGRTQNISALLDGTQALVVDPGPSSSSAVRFGTTLRRSHGARIVAAINTHPHPENVLGNAGLPSGARIYATRRVAALMAQRCPACQRRFVASLGLPAHPVRLPDVVLEGDEGRLEVGGRQLKWRDAGPAHSDADTLLFDPRNGVLFAAGLVSCGPLPELAEGDVDRWVDELGRLKEWPVTTIVPAQGPACGPEAIVRTRAYLVDLREAVDAALQAGADLADAATRLDLPRHRDWSLYGPRHTLNVQRAWRQRETRLFDAAQR